MQPGTSLQDVHSASLAEALAGDAEALCSVARLAGDDSFSGPPPSTSEIIFFNRELAEVS